MKKPYIICEIGQAHDGSLGFAHSFIDALKDCNIDAIKFQTHIASAESSKYEKFRIPFSYQDKTRYDYWKRMEFTLNEWLGLKKHCDEFDLDFISSPFSNAAVDLLEKVNVSKYKIGSGEVKNLLMLEKIAKTKKDIIISSGMNSIFEIDETLEFLKKYDNNKYLLQCTTSYPTNPKNWGLNVIEIFKERYDIPIGFSDHSGDIFACLAAASFGAEIFEFHVVFNKKQFGPDSLSSIEINDVKYLVEGIYQIYQAVNNPIDKNNITGYDEIKNLFEKSLAVNKNMKKNDTLRFQDLESKKPNLRGISAANYKCVIGKKINKDLSKWSFLKEEDIE